MPITAVTFVFGWLAIAGVFPLAGFWAKGDVLSNAFERFPALWAIGLVTALLTAYYMTRLYILAFTGDSRWTQGFCRVATAVDAGDFGGRTPSRTASRTSRRWVMTLPLIVLAALSLLGGLLDLPWWHSGISAPLSWLEPVLGAAPARSERLGDDAAPAFDRRRRSSRLSVSAPDGGCGVDAPNSRALEPAVPPARLVHRRCLRPPDRPAESGVSPGRRLCSTAG